MAKLTRKLLKLFGQDGSSSNFAQYGSLAASALVNTKDILSIQGLQAWLDGWQSAVIGTNKAPLLEDMNALLYVLFYQLCYTFEEGIPEYDSTTTYYTGSVVKKAGTTELYGSRIDSNLGNALPSQTNDSNWNYLNAPSNPVGSVIDFAGSAAPTGWLLCDGSAVSRGTYADLFAIIGTGFGAGNGVTTFNLPDTRGRTSVGAGTGSGLTNRTLAQTIGEETHLLTASESGLQSHTHSVVDPGHTHKSPQGAAGGNTSVVGGGTITETTINTASATTGVTISAVGAQSAASAHNNMQPSIVFNKIIKY